MASDQTPFDIAVRITRVLKAAADEAIYKELDWVEEQVRNSSSPSSRLLRATEEWVATRPNANTMTKEETCLWDAYVDFAEDDEPVPARPLRLTWGNNVRAGDTHVEWHAPCGCAYHPEPEPHVHCCFKHDFRRLMREAEKREKTKAMPPLPVPPEIR